ncbi:MAG: FoF1 ATP synthase subunit delta, partial [Clostridium sp.]
EFVKQYNKVNNIEVAHVRTAKKLDAAEIKRLKSMLEEKLSKTVELHIQEDPDLLAGLRIKINDMVLDNTARSRMDNLKQLAQSESVQES